MKLTVESIDEFEYESATYAKATAQGTLTVEGQPLARSYRRKIDRDAEMTVNFVVSVEVDEERKAISAVYFVDDHVPITDTNLDLSSEVEEAIEKELKEMCDALAQLV